MNTVIMGSGAIGSAIAQRLLEENSNAHCVITYRNNPPAWSHERCHVFQLDAVDEKQYPEFAQFVQEALGAVDCCINTIGLLHDKTHKLTPEKRLADFNIHNFEHVIKTNVIPTVLCAKYLDKLFNKQGAPILATVSAKVGSIEDNRLGGWHSYRASKACLNMMLKNIAIEWSFKKKTGCVVALHPGTTDSALSEPFQKNVPEGKLFSPRQTADYLIAVVQQLEPKDNGSFMSWDGSRIPW